MLKSPSYLSPSSASTYEGCPLRWKYKYIDKLPDPSGQAALVGSFAHLVLEKLCDLPNNFRTKDQARALAKSLWNTFAEEKDYQKLDLNEEETRTFKWQSWSAIEGLWHLEDPAETAVVSTEKKIRTKLGDTPFVGIVDRIDRIDEQLVISDYKSGKAPKPKWQQDKLHQVLLYAAAAAQELGELPATARLLYLGQRTISTPVSEKHIEQATSALNNTWDAIQTSCETEDFEPQTGVLCGWCSFVENCPTGKAEVIARAEAGKLPAHAPAHNILEKL